MMLKRPGFDFSQTYIEHGYVELNIPPRMIDEKNPERGHEVIKIFIFYTDVLYF